MAAATLARAVARQADPAIEANELRRWRDSLLLKGLKPAAVNRGSARRSPRSIWQPRMIRAIKSRQPWHVGLQGLPDATRARNIVLGDDQVRKLISAAYDRGERFGLFVETLGVTGARPSQFSRIEVGDLRAANLAEAKLMMPRSGKGGGRLRIRKKVERISVPITVALAARLKASAADRPSNAPLLLWRDDRGWGVEPSANYRADFRAIVAAGDLDPAEVTAYALRHSSIVRMLLAGIPVRLVASLHDTSVTEIERHYSKYISEGAHSDALSRRALLADEPPVADNVVALALARLTHGPQGQAAAKKVVSRRWTIRAGGRSIAVHKQLVEHDGDPHAAALDLTAALTGDQLRCKWRRIADGAYERVPSAFWTNYKLSYGRKLRVIPHFVTSPPGAVVIRSAALAARLARRPHGDERSRIDMPIGGVVFYVWKPDTDRIWPLLAANMPKPEPGN